MASKIHKNEVKHFLWPWRTTQQPWALISPTLRQLTTVSPTNLHCNNRHRKTARNSRVRRSSIGQPVVSQYTQHYSLTLTKGLKFIIKTVTFRAILVLKLFLVLVFILFCNRNFYFYIVLVFFKVKNFSSYIILVFFICVIIVLHLHHLSCQECEPYVCAKISFCKSFLFFQQYSPHSFCSL